MLTPAKRIRSFLLALILALGFSLPCHGEFFIDNFVKLDNPNDASATYLTSGISVEVSGSGVTQDFANDRYIFTADNIGDSFRVQYTWSGVFDDLQSISGLELDRLVGTFFGNWTLTVNTGVGVPTVIGPSIPTNLGTSIALDDATELTFDFVYDGGSPFPGGTGIGTWGGVANPLFATPEPTGAIMLGVVGLVAMARRRRSADR